MENFFFFFSSEDERGLRGVERPDRDTESPEISSISWLNRFGSSGRRRQSRPVASRRRPRRAASRPWTLASRESEFPFPCHTLHAVPLIRRSREFFQLLQIPGNFSLSIVPGRVSFQCVKFWLLRINRRRWSKRKQKIFVIFINRARKPSFIYFTIVRESFEVSKIYCLISTKYLKIFKHFADFDSSSINYTSRKHSWSQNQILVFISTFQRFLWIFSRVDRDYRFSDVAYVEVASSQVFPVEF